MNHNIQSLRAVAALWVLLFHAISFYLLAMLARLDQVEVVRTLLLLSHKIPDLVFSLEWSFELFFYLAFALLALLCRLGDSSYSLNLMPIETLKPLLPALLALCIVGVVAIGYGLYRLSKNRSTILPVVRAG